MLNVEKVVKAPRKPIVRKTCKDKAQLSFCGSAIPSPKEPIRLISKMLMGIETAGNSLLKIICKTYLEAAPKKPPINTERTSIKGTHLSVY
jgi:hypothetical protein